MFFASKLKLYSKTLRCRNLSNGTLHGVRVLDLSRILAGPFCTQMLGDMGAEVIKIEQPGKGDETRSWGPPFLKGESSYFLSINRNKKSVVVDLQREEGIEIIKNLAKHSDIIVENFFPGKVNEFGISYQDLFMINPRLIYCSLSGFGQTGPLSQMPGYDIICSAMYGMMHITGPEGPCTSTVPVRPGVAMTDMSMALFAHGAILSALYERTQSGVGQYIDSSLMESQLACLVNVAGNYLTGGVDQQNRWGTGHPSIVPYQSFECKDGMHLAIGIGTDKQFQYFCDAVKLEYLYKEADCAKKFSKNKDRVVNRKELIDIIAERMKAQTRDEWTDLFLKQGQEHHSEAHPGKKYSMFPMGPVRTVSESFSCEQAISRNMTVHTEHKKCGPLKLVGFPVKYSRTPCSVALPPPMLGEHTREVLKNVLGFDDMQINGLVNDRVVEQLQNK